ncbi:cobyric acid synthase [Sciscionella marina]|uniref:cobyric acid synthase n=1 Tax=Sciscionella marina TaxID=508770 RepID=UPI00037A859C|nr:cobyric acid synthase [Sciscionella marina]
MKGSLLVAGTTSDAGKSVLVAGICRWLARKGVSVAPFKAQNMSNNSVVTPDGGEIGRAQAMQALAAGIEPDVRLNPVLLKPGSDRSSQVVVRGQVDGSVTAMSYHERKSALLGTVVSTLDELRADHDVVVCEGAGSPAEINLRASDIANMGLARARDLPVLVVGDIDRGGVFAQFYGTLNLLEEADRELVRGFVINKFRGERALLEPGLEQLSALTGRPCYGVLPYEPRLWLDAEDSLSYADSTPIGRPAPPVGNRWLRVAVVRLPRISNGTDIDALACEPGVAARFVTDPGSCADADLIVLPGTKSTVDDLDWLRHTGLAAVIEQHVAEGKPLLGICGGFQMLGKAIVDTVESGKGAVSGLGLLDLDIEFAPTKTLRNPEGSALGQAVRGYEIHHGLVARRGAVDPLVDSGDGALAGPIAATHWHGLCENDAFRRTLLDWAAGHAKRDFRAAGGIHFAEIRAAQLDLLGDLVADHLDTEVLRELLS